MSRRETMEMVVVAVDKNKGSQHALRWTIENLITKGQTLTLLHVAQKQASEFGSNYREALMKELFLPFRTFCSRKEVLYNEVVLEDKDNDVVRAINGYASANPISGLVLGAASKGGIVRKFLSGDIPTTVLKSAPEFCTVYIINKGKISSARQATGPIPSNLIAQRLQSLASNVSSNSNNSISTPPRKPADTPHKKQEPVEMRSVFNNGRAYTGQSEVSVRDLSDISFVSSGRPSTEYGFNNTNLNFGRPSNSSEYDNSSYTSSEVQSVNYASSNIEYSSGSQELSNSGSSGSSGQTMDNLDLEMRRLQLELKKTMDYYHEACKEAEIVKQKAKEIREWKAGEGQKLEQARLAEAAALKLAEKERANSKAALEAAAMAQRIAELESQRRKNAEKRVLEKTEDRQTMVNQVDLRYRRYSIEEIEQATEYFSQSRKIGEGGYGPVFKCKLDHTTVAIKVLRPDAAQGRSQFNQEIEVLSSIRHPNMVLLLGACPEYGCLVYEHMARGSLEDQLFPRGNTRVLSWQQRFRISAEIATGLLFLHQSKPEPLVHRDLKPGNILLDSNYVSKISDVGLARLVPPKVADAVTQYHMTSAAGTFCYIDPEYQQTGMLGVKSDVYSFGIMLLQIITARPPMGLTHQVEHAIENGTFSNILDPAVPDWPIEEALTFAKLALKCAELRRKDRPDLGSVVLPELRRLSALGEDTIPNINFRGSPAHSQVSTSSFQDATSETDTQRSGSSIPSYSNGGSTPCMQEDEKIEFMRIANYINK